jgi:putative YhdH/YhfP family quinone oxidoreductase
MQYKALLVEELEGKFTSDIKTLETDTLAVGDVLVKVMYSSLNYKDALSITGNKGVTKKYPHTPGIDAAGIVEYSDSDLYQVGDEVIVTGYDLGMNTPGGFGQYIRVPAEWVVKLPVGLTLKESMIIGTAGFTAGISVSRLTDLVKPTDGNIIVTGATGGVGSMAVALLSKLGYQVVAVSGKQDEFPFLQSLGASEIISRADFQEVDKRPILSSKFAGGIDTVGGPILENIIKSLQPLGAITTCGSVSSTQLNLTVFPFILRGITLIGISAQNYPTALRQILWNKMASDWKLNNLEDLCTEISMEEILPNIDLILQGKLKGRTIVKM